MDLTEWTTVKDCIVLHCFTNNRVAKYTQITRREDFQCLSMRSFSLFLVVSRSFYLVIASRSLAVTPESEVQE